MVSGKDQLKEVPPRPLPEDKGRLLARCSSSRTGSLLQAKIERLGCRASPAVGGATLTVAARHLHSKERPVPGNMATSLVTKLMVSNILDEADIRAILNLPIRARAVGSHESIVKEGDRPHDCCLIGDGFAFRSKTTSDGQRLILSLHIPGEIPDLQSLHLKLMDHDLTTLTPCTLGFVPHEAVRSLARTRPNVAAALWRETLIDAAIFREWVVDLGRS